MKTVLQERIKERRQQLGLTLLTVAEKLNTTEATIQRYESGNIKNIPHDRIVELANALNCSPAYLMGWSETIDGTKNIANAIVVNQNHIHMLPIYESVSAGFGAYAADYITDYMPCYVPNKAEAEETICVIVHGDSMFPKIENGDIIQVHKQTSVDSGAIAVVLLDKSEALVKKVIYGTDWIELHSINPMYQIQRFEGKDVLRIEVLGLVKKIIKNV